MTGTTKKKMILTEEHIELVAKEVLQWPSSRKWNSSDKDRRIRSFFGAPSNVVADLWNRIRDRGGLEDGAKPKHLLWALVFLKNYSPIEILCSIVGWPSTKTFSKWAWYFVERISEMKDDLIKLENRFDGLDGVAETSCFISVDGTDCPVYEPSPFDRKMYSHKLDGPGVKYEVAVCIKTAKIVWINGPFIASKNDTTIFTEGLSHLLYDDEGVEVDKGYRGDNKMKRPGMGISHDDRKMKSNARAQHEIVNGRLKHFGVLTTHFRHMKPNRDGMMKKHKLCFDAVAVITQLKFIFGESIFAKGLDYNVAYW